MTNVAVPRRLFHGSAATFEAFEPGHFNGFTSPREGIYLTEDLVTCREFGEMIYEVSPLPCALFDARDVYDLGLCERVEALVHVAGGDARECWESVQGRVRFFVKAGGLQIPGMRDALVAQGFDGMVFWDEFGRRGFEAYVLFDPKHAPIVSVRDLTDIDFDALFSYDWEAEAPSTGVRP